MQASWRAAASAPTSRATTVAPVRSPHFKLVDRRCERGAGDQHHLLPARRVWQPTPMVVVPVPFTPTVKMTWGLALGSISGLGDGREDLRFRGQHRPHTNENALVIAPCAAHRDTRRGVEPGSAWMSNTKFINVLVELALARAL